MGTKSLYLKIYFVGNLEGEHATMVYGQGMLKAHGDKSNFLSISFKQEGHVTYGCCELYLSSLFHICLPFSICPLRLLFIPLVG